jgi:hypothetical protein
MSSIKLSNPISAIKGNGSLLPEIERLLAIPKSATEILPRGRGKNKPKELILRIKANNTHFGGMKLLAKEARGQWFITFLTDKNDIIRQYHYQYNGHPNPDSSITDRSHKHFPTKKYPLLESHNEIDTWAYNPEPFPDDFIEAIKSFCKECNISLEAIQERLRLE